MTQFESQSMNEAATVLLTGGTAQVGLHILPKLLEAGFDTFALSRQLSGRPCQSTRHAIIKNKPSGARLSWFSPDQFKAMADSPGPEVLISAGPISLAVEWLQSCRCLQKVVCISTTSVFSKADSSNQAEKQQIEEIIHAEKHLMELCATRNVGLAILRPTLIYGCGLDENISRLAQFIRRYGFLPMAGAAKGLRQPVHVADLAELVVQVARSEGSGLKDYTVTGGSTLSYREMAGKIFKALGKTERMPSFPPRLLSTAVAAAGKLTGSKAMNAAMVLRQNQDLVFDDSATRSQFAFNPRTFEPSAEDFQLPAELRQYLPG